MHKQTHTRICILGRETEVTLDSSPSDWGEHVPANLQELCVCMCEFYYLYKEDNEKIEVGYPSELLKQILWDKIPNCVLKKKEKKQHLEKRLWRGYLSRFQ